MKHSTTSAIAQLGATFAMVASSNTALAQTFPSKQQNHTVIMSVAPSGGIYVAMRMMADQIQEKTGTTIVFDPAGAGGAGTLTPARVMRSKPDGYTIGMIYSSPMTLSPLVAKDVPYDPLKDFTYITMLTRHGLLFVSTPNFAPNNLQELVALAKARPDTVKIGTNSTGTLLALLQLEAAAGIKLFSVPYKQAAQSDVAAMTGELNMSITSTGNVIGQVRSNKLKSIFIGTRNRSALQPQVQSVAETYPNLEFVSWYGLYAPAGIPSVAVDWYYREWTAALKDPKMLERVENNLAVEVVATPGQVLLEQIRRELARNAVTVKQHNITE